MQEKMQEEMKEASIDKDANILEAKLKKSLSLPDVENADNIQMSFFSEHEDLDALINQYFASEQVERFFSTLLIEAQLGKKDARMSSYGNSSLAPLVSSESPQRIELSEFE